MSIHPESECTRPPQRAIGRRERSFLLEELQYWQQLQLMDDAQAEAIQQLYRSKKTRFFHLLTGLGGLLIGLGVLSVVASNWFETPRWVRSLMVLVSYVGMIVVAWRLVERDHPVLSRLSLLLGSFIYGGGIFLMGQMYHYGGHWTSAMAWWLTGLLPTVLLLRDRWQMLLVQVLTLIFINGLFFSNMSAWPPSDEGLMSFVFPLWPWLFLSALWGLELKLWKTPPLHSLTTLITINTLGTRFLQSTKNLPATLLLLGGIGLAATLYRHQSKELHISSNWGLVLFGFCGLILSIPAIWQNHAVTLALTSGLLTALVGLVFLVRGYRVGVVLFCAVILRYYFDGMYGFLSKAAFFTGGGIILLLMGWLLERLRQRTLGDHQRENPS